MEKYIAVITEADIRFFIEKAAAELEEDKLIRFPNREARSEFIEDCISCELDMYELYDSDPFRYRPNHTVEVLDMAELYGYINTIH